VTQTPDYATYRTLEIRHHFSWIQLAMSGPSAGKRPKEKGWQRYCAECRPLEQLLPTLGNDRPNLGITTGPASGLIVLDIDDPRQFETFIETHNLDLPDTLTVRTGSGGYHSYFKYPVDGKQYGNRTCKDWGFDVRGNGGQVVAPGSVHLEAGQPYVVKKWEGISRPPAWLAKYSLTGNLSGGQQQLPVTPPDMPLTNRANDIDSLPISPATKHKILSGAPKGQRSEAIMTVLNALAWSNLGDSEIFDIFENYPIGEKYREKHKARKKWLKQQIDKAQQNVTERAQPRNPTTAFDNLTTEATTAGNTPWLTPTPLKGTHPQTTELDLSLLSPDLFQAASETARFVKVPKLSPALVGLAVLAVALGRKAVVVERNGLEHFPTLFICLVAASGERKTPVFQLMTRPLVQWATNHQAGYEAEFHRIKFNNMIIDKTITSVIRKSRQDDKTIETATNSITHLKALHQPLPTSPRLFTSDTTEEKLFDLMHSHGGSYAVLTGEGRPVIEALLGKYSNGRTGEAIYLAGVSGDTITRDRVGGESGPIELMIAKPCLNICVMVQPDKFLELARHPGMRASGTLARILTAWLPSMVGNRFEAPNENPLNPSALEPFYQLIQKLLETPAKEKPHKAKLSSKTAEARRVFHNNLEYRMRKDGDLSDVADIASKIVTHTTKVALLLHLSRFPEMLKQDESEIDLSTWEGAQTIVEPLLKSAIETQRMAGEDKAMIQAQKLADWFKRQKNKIVTRADILQRSPRPRPKAGELSLLLKILCDFGYCRPTEKQNEHEINPQWLAGLATLASPCINIEKSKVSNALANTAKMANEEQLLSESNPNHHLKKAESNSTDIPTTTEEKDTEGFSKTLLSGGKEINTSADPWTDFGKV
jgi:hypothetical protein